MTKKVYALGLIVLLSAVCLTSIAAAQTSWWRTYGGANGDAGNSVQQTSDGGYVIAGWTESFGAGNRDIYLVKTNAQGDTLWTRTYGGSDDDGSGGSSVQQTTDSGYIIVSNTHSFGAGNGDVYLIKTDAQGDTLWTRTYGGTNNDVGYSVRQIADGGYIITGETGSFGAGYRDVYLVKTYASGDTLWTRTYGGTEADVGYSVQQTAGGGYVVTGYTYSFNAVNDAVYLVRTDSSGDTLWTRTYDGTTFDWGSSVQRTADGGYIIVGGTSSFGAGNDDVYLIKTDSLGDTLWTRTYGGTYDDRGYSVQQTADGGYAIVGVSGSFGAGSADLYFLKTSSSGDTLWIRTYGGPDLDMGYSVQQTTDDGYIIAGYTRSLGAGDFDVYLIKTDANGYGIEEPLTRHPANPTRVLVRPNPFTSFARVPGHETELFALSDVTGREVAVCKGDRVGEGLRAGVYFLSPVGLKTGRAVTGTIIKAAF